MSDLGKKTPPAKNDVREGDCKAEKRPYIGSSGNPEFDKAVKDMLGDEAKNLYCQKCNTEKIECPSCHDMICPGGCSGG